MLFKIKTLLSNFIIFFNFILKSAISLYFKNFFSVKEFLRIYFKLGIIVNKTAVLLNYNTLKKNINNVLFFNIITLNTLKKKLRFSFFY